MFIAILGRQAALGAAELERFYGTPATSWFSDTSLLVDAPNFSLDRFGGTRKAGRVVLELPAANWRSISMKIVKHYTDILISSDGKVTLGISTYGFTDTTPRDVQKTAIILKQKLREHGVSLRALPNVEVALNTATSHHNRLGLAPNKIELLVVFSRELKRVIVAESIGAQNISAYAARDQARPKRDAFVGMLPPKLAQIMINLALGTPTSSSPRLLDPFCGTGVILQEALLAGYTVYGSDLSDKMVDYTRQNLSWLHNSHDTLGTVETITLGDATACTWPEASSLDAVVCETYLGQPFSAPPAPAKLTEVRGNCNHIISQFLTNIGRQLTSGTPLCLAVPAWRDTSGRFTHLPFITRLPDLGFEPATLTHVNQRDLLYYREGQIVARELLVLKKI